MKTEAITITQLQHLKVRSLVGWGLLGVFLAGLVCALMPLLTDMGKDHPIMKITSMGIITLWPLLWIWRKFTRYNISGKKFIGALPKDRHWIRWILLVIGLVILSIGGFYLIWYPLSFVVPNLVEKIITRERVFSSTSGGTLPLSIIGLKIFLGVVIAPFVEELCFRGIILQRWAAKWGLPKSIFLSSLIFGILHFNLVGSMFFGFVMAILYIRTRSLLVPIVCHALNNAIAYGLEGTFFYINGPVTPTIGDLQAGVWFGAICLCITVPLAVIYSVKYWPHTEWKLRFPTGSDALPDHESTEWIPRIKKHLILLSLLSVIVGIITKPPIISGTPYIDTITSFIVTVVLFVIVPFMVIAIPSGIYWLCTRKPMPGFIPLVWIIWVLLSYFYIIGQML
jgi:CAAX protease family protein